MRPLPSLLLLCASYGVTASSYPNQPGCGAEPPKKILTILSSTQDIHRNLYEHRSRIKRSFPVGISHRREEERQEQQEQQEQQELQELQGTDRR